MRSPTEAPAPWEGERVAQIRFVIDKLEDAKRINQPIVPDAAEVLASWLRVAIAAPTPPEAPAPVEVVGLREALSHLPRLPKADPLASYFLPIYERGPKTCWYCHRDKSEHDASDRCPIRGCTLQGPPTIATEAPEATKEEPTAPEGSGDPDAEMGATAIALRNSAPERVFLILGPPDFDCPCVFDDIDDVVWAQQKMDDTDVEYIRADLVEALRERVKELEGQTIAAYKLITCGILTEDGGDPDAGIDWIKEVDKWLLKPDTRAKK